MENITMMYGKTGYKKIVAANYYFRSRNMTCKNLISNKCYNIVSIEIIGNTIYIFVSDKEITENQFDSKEQVKK